MDSLKQALEQLMPKSLDDIIRHNRDKAQLYLSKDEELHALQGPLGPGMPKALVASWAFITMRLLESETSFIYLVGFNQTERSMWMTSFVTGIDGRKVTTKRGSFYELVGDSQPDVDLPHICATLHHWGLGALLGVPHFFF